MTALSDLQGGAVQYRAATVEDVDEQKGEVYLLAAPYEVEGDAGPFDEVFSVGTFARAAKDPARLGLWNDHGGPLVGRGVAAEETPKGFYMRAKVSLTTAGKDLLIEIADGTKKAASVEFIPQRDFMTVQERAGRYHIRHRRAHLRGAAVVFEGAYPGAEVLSVRDSESEKAREQARLWLEEYRNRGLAL